MANNAIGILFEVQGGGDINGASGKRINGQLRNLIGQINKSDTVKLKFQIDSNYFNQQIKQLQQQLQSLSAGGSPSGSGKGSSQTSQTQQQTKAYREASAAVTNYYNLLTQLQNAMTRTTAIVGSQTEGFRLSERATAKETERWGELVAQVHQAREAYTNATSTQNASTMTAEQYAAVLERSSAAQMKFNLQSSTSTANAQAAWGNLTAKVHDYVSRVEYSASRNKFAAQSLQELRNMANSTDYRGYDALKQKLAEVQQYINQNALATETWGQKMLKTFGSRVRSALAGIVTVKVGQYLRDVYNNVVELDTAMTNLQIASGKTHKEVEALTKSYSKLAQQLGATTVEVAEAADTWLRQGYAAEEATTLIKNSTMLAKLGQIEASEASTALTSAMKGYKVSVEDSISVVDKLTAVDMEAAASAGDIATAMAETATSADIAGVSMDELIGYIATVKEVTQDGAESVGIFYKTLFARMNNVAAGKFIDDETGESLNDVETVLNELGIALRDVNGEFRSSSTVLAEVGSRWDDFNTVQQHAIATAMAGTRQQEKFIVLMENYGNAMKYAETSTNAAGTATEKYTAYTMSLEGRINSLTASFETFSMNILDSEVVAFVISAAEAILNALNAILSFGNGGIAAFAVAVSVAILSITLLNKALTGLGLNANLAKTSFGDLVAAIQLGSASIGQALLKLATNPVVYIGILIATFAALSQDMPGISAIVCAAILGIGIAVAVACHTANNAVWAFMVRNPIGWILAAVTALVLLIMSVIKWIQNLCNANAEARKAALETAAAMQEQADAMKEVADAAEEAADSVKTLVDELEELQSSGDLDASEWIENIDAIGEEVTKLYPDEHLTSLQAINRLLEEEYTYNDLINMTMQERIDLLAGIENGSRALSAQAARDAYVAQKNASSQLAYVLTNYGYELTNDNETWTWDNLKGNQIKSAIAEAEDIASGLSGVHMSANAGKDIDIKIDGANITEYVENLRAAVDEYEERYKYNFGALSENAVYKYLSDSLAQAEESLSAQQSAFTSFIEQTATLHGAGLVIDFDEESTKDKAKAAYNAAVDELVKDIRNDSDVASAINEGLLGKTTEEQDAAIKEYAQEYIRKYHTELFNAVNDMPVIVPLKSAIDIFDDLEGEFGLIRDAMEEFNESGSVSAETIRSITDEFPELLKYINQTENGFEMLGQSMDEIMTDYWKAKAQEYADDISSAYEYYNAVKAAYDGTLESYQIVNDAYTQLQNAIESGNNFITAQNVLTDDLLEEQYTEILESQKDALEEQADAYEELCDIRKELLKSYEDERKYVKELKKKQKAVNKLSTQLSVARLDTSASGQARVRELKAELEEAQEELDDFTLEHAIDIVTKQIDDSNDQYKRLIENSVSRLEATINGVGSMTAEAMKDAIAAAGETPIIAGGDDSTTGSITDAIADATTGVTGDNTGSTTMPEKTPIEAPKEYREPEPEPVVKPVKTKLEKGTDYSVSGMNAISWGKDDITVTINGKSYDTKIGAKVEDQATINALNNLYGGSLPERGSIAVHNGVAYISDGKWRQLVEEDVTQLTNAYLNGLHNYHTGGFVGSDVALDSNEEFAKLLKGEFVATPTQMHRFMKKTLPEVVSSGSIKNEFNAPLFTIECDNVTSEAIPKLKNVVDEAVKEVKKQLDYGMNRVGYKKTAKKLLI